MRPINGSRNGSLGSLGRLGTQAHFLGPNMGKHKRGDGPLLQPKEFKKPRDFGTQGRMPSLKPTGAPTFFPLSDLAMEIGRKRRKKMGEKGKFPSEAAAGRSLKHPKSLILWDWAELTLPP
ncbi:hypothetical protein ACE6H2_016268 [Prunus campanulata]